MKLKINRRYETKTKFKKITGIDLVNSGYLANEQVVPYYYNDIANGLTVNYYLNFKNSVRFNLPKPDL